MSALTAMADQMITRIVKRFEDRYHIHLAPVERDCLLRDFQNEADEIIDAAYSQGWDDGNSDAEVFTKFEQANAPVADHE
jgi:hypothetical protein